MEQFAWATPGQVERVQRGPGRTHQTYLGGGRGGLSGGHGGGSATSAWLRMAASYRRHFVLNQARWTAVDG